MRPRSARAMASHSRLSSSRSPRAKRANTLVAKILNRALQHPLYYNPWGHRSIADQRRASGKLARDHDLDRHHGAVGADGERILSGNVGLMRKEPLRAHA